MMPTSFLTDAELAQLRADVIDLMPDTCRIERPTTINDRGKLTEVWGTAVASTICRVDPIRQSIDSWVAGQEVGAARWQLTVSWDANIQDGDRIVFDSAIYQVEQLHDDHSKRAVRRAILIRRGESG